MIMTIQMRLHDGNKIKTYTYRKIYKGKKFAEICEGFYTQREGNKWGVLVQLKGKERITLRSFGQINRSIYDDTI